MFIVWERFRKVKFQILATFLANIIGFAQGSAAGWMSPALLILQSDATPLSQGKLSNDDAGWIACYMSVGGIFGNLVYGVLSNIIGTKHTMICTGIPQTISWVMIAFADCGWLLGFARFLAGFSGGGIFAIFPLFVGEIADDYIRGQLGSMLPLGFYSGILLSYIIGSSIAYHIVPWISILIPFAFYCSFVFMPHTPQYLLFRNRIQEAEKSLRFYRNCPSTYCESEIKFQEEFTKFKAIAVENTAKPKVTISDFRTRKAVSAMGTGAMLFAISQFSGTFTLYTYAATIFKETGSNIDPNLSSIIMGCLQISGTLCASFLIDRVGRKMLLLVSTAGGALSLSAAGIYCYMTKSGYDVGTYNMVPVISLSIFLFASAIGISSVPFVMVSEMFPQNVRRIGSSFCLCFINLFAFIMLRCFPILLEILNLYGYMAFTASVSALGFIFILFVVKETKGINLDVLEGVENKNSND